MKKKFVVTLLVLFACIALAVQSSIRTLSSHDDDGRIPPEIVVLGENAKLGKITFNHGDHSSKNYNVDGTAPLQCINCHHVDQPATEVVKVPPLKTAFPADRTTTLTLESLKDPETPSVTSCRSCHIPKGAEPTILTEIPQIKNEKTGKLIDLTNQNAFHQKCAGCHDNVVKARPAVKAPGTMKCMICHKKG